MKIMSTILNFHSACNRGSIDKKSDTKLLPLIQNVNH